MHVDAPITSTQPAAELDLEPRRRSLDLRAEFVDAYGPQVFLALSAVGALFLLPFSIHNFLHAHWLVGAATAIVAMCLVANAIGIAKTREPPFPAAFIFVPALAALGIAMYQQGLIGILWSYTALLLFHFVLPRRTANFFNATIIVLATAMAWKHLGPAIMVRVTATLTLTVLFANIFSWISDAQRRKEADQRQRLDLLVRGTNAGTLEWDAGGHTRFSRRLGQMVGSTFDAGDNLWALLERVHPEDRERIEAQTRAHLATTGRPGTVVHLPPDDVRLLHAAGGTVWVHTEGILVMGARGRVRRYICSFMDISEHIHAQDALLTSHEQLRAQARKLEDQNAQLREAIRVREEVERIARHDLKTPLASIASVPRLLRDAGVRGEREEELLGMVERGALRMLSMVNLTLDMFRMEEGTYRVRAQPVDLAGVARTVVSDLRAHADSKQVAIETQIAPGAPRAKAEELLCYSILANLAMNALEASPDGGTVRVAIGPSPRPRGMGVELSVHNAGAVPAAVRGNFFEKYSTHGKASGTGLGAYSARLMARVQGGELEMATHDADGTVLTLWLPTWQAAEVHAPTAQSAAAGPRGPRTAQASQASQAAQAAQEPAVPAQPGGPSLLIVDDDPYNILVLRSLLPADARVREAINGRAGLEAVAAERPDVIFLDLQMPVMGGPEAASRIRAVQRDTGQAPSVIVAFSAWDDEATRAQCADAGFDHYIVKPASQGEVLAILRGEAPRDAAEDDDTRVDAEALALMPEFIASRREMLVELERAARGGDRRALESTAHALTGSLGMYGFDTASELSRRLTAHAATGELAWLRERCAELVRQFEQDQALVRAGQRC